MGENSFFKRLFSGEATIGGQPTNEEIEKGNDDAFRELGEYDNIVHSPIETAIANDEAAAEISGYEPSGRDGEVVVDEITKDLKDLQSGK